MTGHGCGSLLRAQQPVCCGEGDIRVLQSRVSCHRRRAGWVIQALQATEGQTEELRGHVIIAGFGRVGQIIGQLLAERLIPFVAVDVRMECVQVRPEPWGAALCSCRACCWCSGGLMMLVHAPSAQVGAHCMQGLLLKQRGAY